LATSDPHLHAIAWDLQARVAMAESDLQGARASIQKALAIIDRFEILFAAWQTLATATQVYKYAKEIKTAEAYRDRAESCILQIADSFEPNEPLRATFLNADPVRRILCEKVVHEATRQHKLSGGAVL
jgi:tetratricopeptide (TPR) repeat protein